MGTLGGVQLCSSVRQALDGPASIVGLLMLACGRERGCGDCSTPYMWLSSNALLPWLPGFLPQACPTSPQSPPSHPLDPSLCSQQKPLPWGCSTIPKLQLITITPSRGPAFLSRVCMAASRTVWFSFHLGCYRSAVSFSALNVSSLTQAIAPMWGSDPCFSSPTQQGQVQFYKHSGITPSSFILLCFAWFYISFSSCQVLLTTFSWCLACTSVSEGVFLMYPWRDTSSKSSYSSAILFSPISFYKVKTFQVKTSIILIVLIWLL